MLLCSQGLFAAKILAETARVRLLVRVTTLLSYLLTCLLLSSCSVQRKVQIHAVLKYQRASSISLNVFWRKQQFPQHCFGIISCLLYTVDRCSPTTNPSLIFPHVTAHLKPKKKLFSEVNIRTTVVEKVHTKLAKHYTEHLIKTIKWWKCL